MRIVLHAGLHKSGTTSVQFAWRQAYAEGSSVWYPSDPEAKLPGHHGLVWPLIDAFTQRRANDLVWGSVLSRRDTNLTHVVAEAVERNVDVLLISTEELDRVAASDAGRFAELLQGHDVTVLLTMTRPLHRWCSGWQELVKHGLCDYPNEAADEVMAFASLTDGRVEELLGFFPAGRRVVRVVRTSPHEDALGRDLAELVGLAWPEVPPAGAARNVSMGVDIEILRRINRLDRAMGTVHGEARPMISRYKEAGLTFAERPELAAAYDPPPAFWKSAEREQRFLRDLAAGADVEVVDPHDQLDGWLDAEPPAWYAEIATREAVIPELDVDVDLELQLWRVRQERSALSKLHDRDEEQLELLTQTVEQLESTIEKLHETAVRTEEKHRREIVETRESMRVPRRARRVAGRLKRRLRRSLRATGKRLNRAGT